MIRQAAALAFIALAGCAKAAPEQEASATPPPSACEGTVFEGVPLTHCTAWPGRHAIRLVAGNGNGEPYRTLPALAAARSPADPDVVFAMNAGMFDADGGPIGYAVAEGRRVHALNRRDGWGNFHMKPNGVFFGDALGRWKILPADDFAEKVRQRPAFGTQSGPILVIGGKLHPKIAPDGASAKLRNGVGIDAKGRAHFVISDAPISFGKLARYFRDRLNCKDALFLDGSVSSLWDPEHGRIDSGPPLGPLIVVEKAAKGGP